MAEALRAEMAGSVGKGGRRGGFCQGGGDGTK